MREKQGAARWEFLDSIRAIAAMFVLADHWMKSYTPRAFEVLLRYCSPGVAGVAAFFLVSGFIIPVSLEKYGSLRTFWAGRFFRLMPLYLFTLALAWVCRHVGLFPPLAAAPAWRVVAANLLMAQDFLHVPPPLYVYWTLSYEAVFYLACSVLFVAGVLRKSAACSLVISLLFLAATLVAGLAFHRALSAEKAAVVVTAFFGTVLYRYSIGSTSARMAWTTGAFFAVSLATAFWFRLALYPKANLPATGFLPTTVAWVAGCGVFLACFLLRHRKFPRVLLFLGQISYSIYLVHPFVFTVFHGRVSSWASLPLLLACTVGFAYCTYRYVETPGKSLQKRLAPKRLWYATSAVATTSKSI